MSAPTLAPVNLSSIIDNQGENTLKQAIEKITVDGRELWIATAFFSLDALNLIGENLLKAEKIRLLYGAEASPRERNRIIQALQDRSDEDLLRERKDDPLLQGLHFAKQLIDEGRLEARIYRKQNFHAKLYISHRTGEPPISSIVGSGNFTRSGLTMNVELNLKTQEEQTEKLVAWYQEKWAEAEQDDITEILSKQIARQIELYPPHLLYLKALMLWGDWIQGRDPLPQGRMLKVLDPHQIEGYRRALKVLRRDDGVMICDGVGLGKSFIALALMEYFIGKNKRVLLVAPKAILDSAWDRYFKTYLPEKDDDFASVRGRSVDYFGRYAPRQATEESELLLVEKLKSKGESGAKRAKDRDDFLARLESLSKKADVVIIDESHNLRTPFAQRYLNAMAMLHPEDAEKKKIVLLTATPLNTKHVDLTAQWGLIAGLDGSIGTRPLAELRKLASSLDSEMRKDPERQLELNEKVPGDRLMLEAMKRLAIQRSRAECKRIGEAAGKRLRFPKRRPPEVLEYKLSPTYSDLVDEVEREFTKLAKMIRSYREEVKRASKAQGSLFDRKKVQLPRQGIRLSAYMPNLYRYEDSATLRESQVESFLASLVFTNVMKQFESSPVAFQSIIQSLGAGLCARLLKIFPEDERAQETVDRHRQWINVLVRTFGEEAGYDDNPEAEDVIIAGDVPDPEEDPDYLWRETHADRVNTALRSAAVRNALPDFSDKTHNVAAWRRDIESDLHTLERLAENVRLARQNGEDLKLACIADVLQREYDKGRKVLVFTQSVRTAEYLEDTLPRLVEGATVRRIDANVGGARRQRLLNAFSPRYNPAPFDQDPLPGLERLDILISTDVLSEGVNLQEAGCILNYDLHWNPVRLIQRIGRVDRRLADDDPEHEFDIFNVFPPPELERILNLVGTVEGRVAAISRLLGIDQSFFKSTDPEGTLKEFDGMVDGTIDADEDLLREYNSLPEMDSDAVRLAESVPPGAFGAWKGSGTTGAIAVFTMQLHKEAPEGDREKFGAQVGTPIFVMKTSEPGSERQKPEFSHDPVAILSRLARTVPGEPSAKPSMDGKALRKLLAELREEAEENLPAKLPQSVGLELVLWLELQP